MIEIGEKKIQKNLCLKCCKYNEVYRYIRLRSVSTIGIYCTGCFLMEIANSLDFIGQSEICTSCRKIRTSVSLFGRFVCKDCSLLIIEKFADHLEAL